jgi:hypothetical protein
MFNASGSFSDAKEELYKRGLKALFKMYKCLIQEPLRNKMKNKNTTLSEQFQNLKYLWPSTINTQNIFFQILLFD